MRHNTLSILVFAFFLGSGLSLVHGQARSDSRLWRISGNGLAAPSYLFASTSSSDPLVFVVSDSVRSAFDRCKLVLTEKDPGLSDLAERFHWYLPYEGSFQSIFSESEMASINRRFAAEYHISLSYLSPDRVYVDLVARKTSRSRQMPIQLDRLIMEMALKKGGEYRSIEEVRYDMLPNNLPGEMWKPYLEWKLSSAKSSRESLAFQQAYLRGDMEALQSFLKPGNDFSYYLWARVSQAEFEARRQQVKQLLAKEMYRQTTFAAISAEYLGGSDGLIASLQSRGFKVEPIKASGNRELSLEPPFSGMIGWRTYSPPFSNLSLQLPAMPAVAEPLFTFQEVNPFHVCQVSIPPYDGAKLAVVSIPLFDLIETPEQAEEVVKLIAKDLLVSLRSGYNQEDFEKNGKVGKVNGNPSFAYRDYSNDRPISGLRLKVIRTKLETILLIGYNISTAEEDQIILTAMESLELPAPGEEIVKLTVPELGFEISLFDHPISVDSTFYLPESPDHPTSTFRYFSHAGSSARNVNLNVTKLPKGMVYPNDRVSFQELATLAKEVLLTDGSEQRDSTIDGYPAMVLTGPHYEDGELWKITMVFTIREAMMYILSTQENESNHKQVEKVQRSFHFIPFPAPDLQVYRGLNDLFQMKVPGDVTPKKYLFDPVMDSLRSLITEEFHMLEAQDPYSANTLTLTVDKINPLIQHVSSFDSMSMDLLIRQILMREDGYELVQDSSFTLNGTMAYEFFVRVEETQNRLRVLTSSSGNWRITAYVFASPSYLRLPSTNEMFYSLQFEDPLPPSIQSDKSDKIIDLINNGDSIEVQRALNSVMISSLGPDAIDAYLAYLRAEPPFLHPDGYRIISTLLSAIAATAPDSLSNITRLLVSQSMDPVLQAEILLLVNQAEFEKRAQIIAEGIQRVNWRMFQGAIPALFSLIENNQDSTHGAVIWRDMSKLLPYKPWQYAIAIYLPFAITKGFLPTHDIATYQAAMQQSARQSWEDLQNNVPYDAEIGEPDHAAALVTFLNALSSFPATKEIKKLVKEIGKQNQDTSIINQLVYCKLVWGGKVKPAELTPILENPFSRRKVLLELEKQGKMSLASPAFLTKAAMAEADVIMSITDGFASLSPSSSQLAAQWQEEQGERFVYRLTFENDLQIYYILSPAYELDPLNPAYPPNSFLYVIPTEGNDEPTQEELRATFQELLAGLSE